MRPTVQVRLINDSLVLPWRIGDEPAQAGSPYADVAGTVRPATPAELAAFRSRLAAAKEEEAVRVEAEFIARHLKEWNVADEQGVLYPITPQNVERTPEDLFVLLTPVVAGRTGGVEFVLGKSGSPSASPATTPGG